MRHFCTIHHDVVRVANGGDTVIAGCQKKHSGKGKKFPHFCSLISTLIWQVPEFSEPGDTLFARLHSNLRRLLRSQIPLRLLQLRQHLQLDAFVLQHHLFCLDAGL